MKRSALLPALLIAAAGHAGAADPPAAGFDRVRGVNPADNLTKFELLPKYAVIDGAAGISVSTLTLKYDRAINGRYGINLELPLGAFDSPFLEGEGTGDLNIRGRIQFTRGGWTFIGGLETVLPTATLDTLGSGKFQLNPTFVAVKPFSAQTFAAVVAKHMFSVGGDAGRADIVQGQYRLLMAHTTAPGGWILADPQLWVDYARGSRVHFAPELEVGMMIRKTTGIWLRGGARLAGGWDKDDWNISAGIRFISF